MPEFVLSKKNVNIVSIGKYLFLSHQRLEKHKHTLSFSLAHHPLSASFPIFVPLHSDPFPIFSSHLFPSLSLSVSSVCPVSCRGCIRRTTWCVAVQKRTKGSDVEKSLCAASADHLTRLLPPSVAILTGSAVCQRKGKQRGSVHPGHLHRTLFILFSQIFPTLRHWNQLVAQCLLQVVLDRPSGSVLPPDWGGKMWWCQIFLCLAQLHLCYLSCYVRRERQEQWPRIKGQV